MLSSRKDAASSRVFQKPIRLLSWPALCAASRISAKQGMHTALLYCNGSINHAPHPNKAAKHSQPSSRGPHKSWRRKGKTRTSINTLDNGWLSGKPLAGVIHRRGGCAVQGNVPMLHESSKSCAWRGPRAMAGAARLVAIRPGPPGDRPARQQAAVKPKLGEDERAER